MSEASEKAVLQRDLLELAADMTDDELDRLVAFAKKVAEQGKRKIYKTS